MSAHNDSTGRIEAGSKGLGEASEAAIRRRAEELALQEGRSPDAPGLFERARKELQKGTGPAEPDDEAGVIAASGGADEAIGDRGHQVKNRGPADEANVVRELTEEGVEEAAHQQMTQAEREALAREKGSS